MSPTPIQEPPRRSPLLVALATGAIIALAGANVYLYTQIEKTKTEMGKMRESILAEVGSVRDASSVSTQAQMRHIETLKQQLTDEQARAQSLTSQAKAESAARVEQLGKQLANAQNAMHQQLNTEISGVRQQAETANAKIADVSTDVGGVKTQVASTKAELDKTIADLKSVRGDMGVQSGLIATNANELTALRRLGERNYYEFKIGKTKDRQRVGDISILLKKTDQKKNKYTVEIMADDKLTEKKDKGVNEPVQFYSAKARQPYELVVNSVGKDLISGYLSTPKDAASR